MKEYEDIWNFKLPKHNTIIIRVDGKRFSKLTTVLNKPFDATFHTIMELTAIDVAKQIDGCKMAYCQSDEVTFILNNYGTQTPYFDGRIQKISSIVAANMTVNFYTNYLAYILEYQENLDNNLSKYSEEDVKVLSERISNLWKFLNQKPIFDARCYIVPSDEEIDVLIERQNSSINNSILSIGQYYIGKKEVEGLKNNEIIDILKNNSYNIEDILTDRDKYGAIIYKDAEIGWTSQVATRFLRESDDKSLEE